MIPQTGTILCVEFDEAPRTSRCEALTAAGYTAVSTSPHSALAILTHRKFDIIVTSGLSDEELGPIAKLGIGAEILSFDGFILPTVVLFLVDERLRQLRPTPDGVISLTKEKARTTFLGRSR